APGLWTRCNTLQKNQYDLLCLRGHSDYNPPFPVNKRSPTPHAMQIGPYQLKNNLIVAPMAGVTDRPFRQLCKTMGAGMAVSEMVASNSLLWGSEKTRRRANHEGEVE